MIFKKFSIKKIQGITISQLSDEFIIHFFGDNDLNLIYSKRSDIIQILDDAYFKLKRKRLKYAEINEICLNPYIEYKSKKDLNKKKSSKKIRKKENKEEEIIKDEINESNDIKNNQNEKIELSINEDKEEPINDVNFEKMEQFGGVEETLSEIQNKEENIIIDEIKENPLIETKPSIDMIASSHKNKKEVKNEDFKLIKIIGRGSFGKVCLVEYLPTHEIYAMKSLKKDLLIQQEKIESTLLEKEILEKINHPFLINLIYCFQTEQRINFVIPFIPGGELFQYLKNIKHFGEEKAKFYAAQIAIAVQYLHDMGYIYRDLKPENILIDEKGYLRLTDFGLAKKLKKGERTNSFCGTPEYLAPEIIKGENYDMNVDWWALGIIIYEMICGIPPFYVQDLEKMYYLIKNEKIKFDKKYLVSKDAKDLITRLLDKNVENRLCSHNGIEEIKKHPFFKNVDFDAIFRKEVEAPYIPKISNSTDVRNFDELFTNEKLEMSTIASKNLDIVKNNQYKFDQFIY